MIRIISRDAVFSRMLTILFSGEARVTVSDRASDVSQNIICLWDEESMGTPQVELPSSCIVITPDENLVLPHGTRRVFRPFKLDELKKHVLGYIREGEYVTKEFSFDDESSSVIFADVTVKLSPAEYLLLRKLYEADGELVSKEEALNVFDSDESNVLEVYIYYLRKKLKKLPCKPEITTVRGKGYILKKGDLN